MKTQYLVQRLLLVSTIALATVGPARATEVLIATGRNPSADGFLRAKPDPYGALLHPTHSDGTPLGSDFYNPAGADLGAKIVTFSSTFYFFTRDPNRREMLNTYTNWQSAMVPDDSLECEVTMDNQATDTNGDLADDQLVSRFKVFGDGVDLTFDLTQHVERAQGAVSTLTQTYVVTNNLTEPIDFVLQRNVDMVLEWVGNDLDDSVGTYTNDHPELDRFVFAQEVGEPDTAITMSSPGGDAYGGAKMGINPDPADPDCPPYNWGSWDTDYQHFGMPDCWRNHIANVGYNTDGQSLASPGSSAHTALDIPVSLPPGPGVSTTVEITYTYGQPFPVGPVPPCPWDCAEPADGEVSVVDFLALLAAWGDVGAPCDVDGDGVGVTDFLALLANWGTCP